MSVQIYITKLFENPHEREDLERFLGKMLDCFDKSARKYIIVIQPQAGGADMDLLLISSSAIIIVDLKHFFHVQPEDISLTHLVGNITLPWRYRIAGGLEMTFNDHSPYSQVKQYRYDLANRLASQSLEKFGEKWNEKDALKYLHAWVVIAPGFDGSLSDMDFNSENIKFSASQTCWFKICSLDDLAGAFDQAPNTGLALSDGQMEKLAASLGTLCTNLNEVLPKRLPPTRLFAPPPKREHIIDREIQAETLLTVLDSSEVSIAAIEGISGIGRTALAGWLAYRAELRHFRIYWIDCRENADLTLDKLLAAMSEEIPGLSSSTVRNPKSPQFDRLDAALEFLSQRPTLLFFDDYHVLTQRQSLQPFFKFATRYKKQLYIVATSCERIKESDCPPESVIHVEIQGLGVDDYAKYIRVVDPKIDLTPQQLMLVWQKLSGNPQAFYQSQDIIRASRIADNLNDLPLDKSEFRFKSIIDRLSREAQLLAQQISVVRSRLTFDLISEFCGSDRIKAGQLIVEMLNKFLLGEYPGGKTYFMVELIRAFLIKGLDTNDLRKKYQASGDAFVRLADCSCGEEEKVELLSEAAFYYDQGGWQKQYLETANECYDLLIKNGNWEKAAITARTAAENAAKVLNNEVRCKWIIKELEIARYYLNREQVKARLEEAVKCLPTSGKSMTRDIQRLWQKLEGQIMRFRGVAAYDEHNYPEAILHLNSALGLASKTDDSATIARTLASLARIERHQGRNQESVALFQQAIEIGQKIHDNNLVADGYNHIGLIELSRKDFPVANEWFTKALALAQENTDWTAYEVIRGSLGRTKLFGGYPKEAEVIFRDCLSITRELHESRGIRVHLTNLIEALIRSNQYVEAEALLTELEPMNNSSNDKIGIAWNLKHRGQMLKQRGKFEEGNRLIRRGLEKLIEIGDKDYIPEFEEALQEGSQLSLGIF